MPPQDDFAEKVIQSLKKNQRAVDLTEPPVEDVAEVVAQSDFEARGAQDSGGDGPLTGGNKDINIVPGYGGVAATSVSQINFYWNSPAVPDTSGIGQSIRTTIFNYASSATNPLLVIGGWNGSTNYLPSQNWGGAGSGTTAKIFIDPFRGHITLDYVDLNSIGIASTTRVGSIWYDNGGSRVRVGTGAATAKTFAYTDDIVSATTVAIASATGTTTMYPTFSNVATSSAGVALSVDIDITYNPATNTFNVPVITGTAATFTNFTGSLIGTATTAQNVNVASSGAVTGPFYFAMVNTGTGSGLALSTDTNLSYNAAVDVLTVTNISGTAITATSFSGPLTGNVTGTATTAQSTNVASAGSGANHFITFVNAQTGSGLGQSSDANLTWNPVTDVLGATNISGTAFTATSFSGKLFGDAAGTAATYTNFFGSLVGTATTAQNVNVATSNNATGTFYIPLINTATGSGVALSSDTALSYNSAVDVLTVTNISGTAITATSFSGTFNGSFSGTATTAQNINVATANNAAGPFYLMMSTSSTGSGVALSTDTALSYNSAVDVLTVTNISGTAITGTSLSGKHFGDAAGTAATYTTVFASLVGTATTAQNVNVATSNNATGTFYIPLLNAATGSGLALSSDTALSYNSAVDVLTVTNISGTAITATTFSGAFTGTATTAQNINVVNAATASGTHYLHFSPSATGTGLATSSGTALSYVPSSGTLGAAIFTANGVRIGNASNTIDTFSGNLVLNAAGGTVTVSGNLNVTGNTITVDSTVSTLVDPVFVLGSGAGGTHNNVTDTADRGIEYRRFSGSAITGFFGFSAASGKFTFIPNATITAANTYSGTVGVIDANLSGTAVTATTGTFTNITGTLTGSVSGTATTAQNVNVATTNNAAGTFYIPLINNATGSGVALSSDTALSYNSAVDVLTVTNISGTAITGSSFSGKLFGDAAGTAATYTNFFGSLVGTATTAQNINVATSNNATGTFYIPLINSATGSGLALSSDTALSYNSAVDVLTVTNISGTAITATSFSGTFNGSFSGTATTAQNVNVAAANATGPFYLIMSGNATGSGVALSSDTALSYNSAVDVLSVTNITGTAFTATSFSGKHFGDAAGTAATYTNFFGSLVGTATTAQNVNVATTNNVAGVFYIPLLNAATGSGLAVSTDTSLSYNSAVDVLTVVNISGTAITASTSFNGPLTGNVTGTATTAQNVNMAAIGVTNQIHYIALSRNATGSGVALSSDTALSWVDIGGVLSSTIFSGTAVSTTSGSFTNITGTLTGNVTGNLTGTATTAQNVNLATTNNAAGPFYFAMSTSSTGSGVALSTDTALSYNSAVDVLTVTNISGTAITASTFSGSFSGSATTAQNLNVVAAGSAGAHYLLMSPSASGSGVAVSSDASLSYVPSTDTLTLANISGLGVTLSASSALAQGTYLTIKTTGSDDNSTDDFFIRGLNSLNTSKFSIDANGNLRATTKSFDIPHPTKEGLRLVYGVLEGPEHGVYHRGTVEGKGNIKIQLPEYWSKLVCPDYTVHLTTWGNYSAHIIEKAEDYFTISISSNVLVKALKNIKVDYIVHGSRLDAVLVTEQDA